jgi:hypothetical protein
LQFPNCSSSRRRASPEDALVHLYAEKESPKYERGAMRWLRRYLAEKEPTFKNFAKVVRSLEGRSAGSLPE